MILNMPANFDGEKFQEKFNLSVNDFVSERGIITCPSLPDLTDEDIADCVVDTISFQRILDRQTDSKYNLINIPGWSTWNETEATSYIDEAVLDLPSAKIVLKALSRVLIALRDDRWPDIPEG